MYLVKQQKQDVMNQKTMNKKLIKTEQPQTKSTIDSPVYNKEVKVIILSVFDVSCVFVTKYSIMNNCFHFLS